jgi:hypothetical protein
MCRRVPNSLVVIGENRGKIRNSFRHARLEHGHDDGPRSARQHQVDSTNGVTVRVGRDRVLNFEGRICDGRNGGPAPRTTIRLTWSEVGSWWERKTCQNEANLP